MKNWEAIYNSMVFDDNDEIIDVGTEIMTGKKTVKSTQSYGSSRVKLVEKENIHHLFKQSISGHWKYVIQ